MVDFVNAACSTERFADYYLLHPPYIMRIQNFSDSWISLTHLRCCAVVWIDPFMKESYFSKKLFNMQTTYRLIESLENYYPKKKLVSTDWGSVTIVPNNFLLFFFFLWCYLNIIVQHQINTISHSHIYIIISPQYMHISIFSYFRKC